MRGAHDRKFKYKKDVFKRVEYYIDYWIEHNFDAVISIHNSIQYKRAEWVTANGIFFILVFLIF